MEDAAVLYIYNLKFVVLLFQVEAAAVSTTSNKQLYTIDMQR